VTGDEINAELEEMAQYYGVPAEQIRASLSQQGQETSIADRLRSRKAVEALVNQSKISDGEWIDPQQMKAEAQSEETAETEEKSEEKKPRKKASKKEESEAEGEEEAKEKKSAKPKKTKTAE
jgi:hypothetical protein